MLTLTRSHHPQLVRATLALAVLAQFLTLLLCQTTPAQAATEFQPPAATAVYGQANFSNRLDGRFDPSANTLHSLGSRPRLSQ